MSPSPKKPKTCPECANRRGPQTTEFWITIFTAVAGFGLLVYGVVMDNNTALGLGTALVGLPAAAYNYVRGNLKSRG